MTQLLHGRSHEELRASSAPPGQPGRKGRVAYLCLQVTREGQASHAHVHEIIRGLKERGWEVDLFEPGRAGGGQAPGYLGRLWQFLAVQARMWRQASGADAWYIRTHHLALPTAVWARLARVPVVQEVNGPHEDLFISYPRTRLLASVFKSVFDAGPRLAQSVVVVTPQLKSWLAERLPRQSVEVISNAANIHVFHPEATLRREMPRPYAVFFGALAPWQGIDTLLAAVQTREWPETLNLVILGDGPERERVRKAAAEDRRILPMGPVPYGEVPGIVANSVVSIIPKNDLGDRTSTGLSPLKLYESLACGVPVVVTDLPGQADLVRESGCGRIVAPNDAVGIARAVAEIHGDEGEQRRLGRRGREAVTRDHSWDQRAEQTSVLLSSLARRRLTTGREV